MGRRCQNAGTSMGLTYELPARRYILRSTDSIEGQPSAPAAHCFLRYNRKILHVFDDPHLAGSPRHAAPLWQCRG